MNSVNYSLNVDGRSTFQRPVQPSDLLFSEDAYIATWTGADVVAANMFGGYAGAYAYAQVTITPPADGNYDLTVQSATGFSYTGDAKDADTQLWLYEGSFDPASPLANLVAANEDIDTFTEDGNLGNLLSKLSAVSLLAGSNYVLVVSSREAGLTGTAVVSFAESPAAEPSSDAALGAAPSSGSALHSDTAADADVIATGGAGDDVLEGGSGNDVFTPGKGHDTILGGAGTDIVQLLGHAADYTMQLVDGTLVVSARDGSGSVAMSDIETLSFAGGQGSSAEELAGRLYRGVLGREGNAGEVDYWAGVLDGGALAKFVASEFINSPEAQQLFSMSGSTGFVTGLYESILGRTPAAEEVAYWVNAIAHGADRADLALDFVNSSEYLSHAVDLDLGRSDVGVLLRLYQTIFDRAPDENGLNYWLEQRANGASMRSIAEAFTASTEAGDVSNSAFIDEIYQGGLHRDATMAEKAQLLDLFDRGLDRGQILMLISESPDAVALVGIVTSTLETA